MHGRAPPLHGPQQWWIMGLKPLSSGTQQMGLYGWLQMQTRLKPHLVRILNTFLYSTNLLIAIRL